MGLLWLACSPSFARIAISEGTEDLRHLGSSAELIFHAKVISVVPAEGEELHYKYIATVYVDRWYKGKAEEPTEQIRYSFPGFMSGHDCIDLTRSDSWLIFAHHVSGDAIEFSHDCEGGLPMSSILAPDSPGSWAERLQRDLIAGLDDPSVPVRLANIARLGGLKLRSSATALQRIIDNGTEQEVLWARYACLRSGDLSVLPAIKLIVEPIEDPAGPPVRREQPLPRDAGPLLAPPFYPHPEVDIALEIKNLRSPTAVPVLTHILRNARSNVVRASAVLALQEIKDLRSAPALVEALSDSDRYIKFNAIVALHYLSAEADCKVPPGDADEKVVTDEAAACGKWWRESSSAVTPRRNDVN